MACLSARPTRAKTAVPWAIEMDYQSITESIRALCHGETDTVALMATVVCEVHHAHPCADWTGFYRVTAPDLLKIGPYQGGHGCLVIPFSRGVCGAAARTGQVQNVPDVEAFPDHIACSSSTRSELVLPVCMARASFWASLTSTATPPPPLPRPMKTGSSHFWPRFSRRPTDG